MLSGGVAGRGHLARIEPSDGFDPSDDRPLVLVSLSTTLNAKERPCSTCAADATKIHLSQGNVSEQPQTAPPNGPTPGFPV